MAEQSASGAIYPYSPYCGAPPAPGALWARWNLDPFLLIAVALVLCVALVRRAPPGRRAAFLAGWAVASLALVSPLCPLSVALFSARVGQHMILTSLAAPLIAFGLGGRSRQAASGAAPILAALAYALALWVWHSPTPYLATFTSDAAYWLMHLTTFGAALWLWWEVFGAWGERLGAAGAAILLTILQMGLLGAVITFAERPLYAPHLLTAPAWGLSALADQQLGGVIMWVPAGVILAAALAAGFRAALRRAEARAFSRSAA